MRPLSPVLLNRMLTRVRLRHLQLAVAIAEQLSLHRAAQAIGMSQPAATHALSELEATLGCVLFERHAKGMRLSTFGMAALPMIRAALMPLQAMAHRAALMQQGATSLLRLGAIAAAINGVLGEVLPLFCARHPDVLVDVQELTIDDLMDRLQRSTLDIVVCRQPEVLPEGLEFRPLWHDEFIAVCGAQHPLAVHRNISADELLAQRWLAPPLTGLGPREFDVLFARLGGTPALCQVSCRSAELVAALLGDGTLLAWLPERLIRPLLKRGELVILDWAAHPVPSIGILANREVLQSPTHPGAIFLGHLIDAEC